MASSNDTLINSNNANLKKWRVFVIPYFARGHLIPMKDFADLLSANHPDIEPTMVVTPGNTKFITSSIGKSNKSTQYPVQILTYPFPLIGLKPDVETVGIGKSTESSAIDKAAHMARPGQEQVLRKYKPDAVITDVMFPWIAAIAADLGIPCLFFASSGAFPILIIRSLFKIVAHLGLHDHVTVSGLPGPEIRMPVLELPTFVFEDNYTQKPERATKSWTDVFGFVVNTCRGLELDYCNEFEKTQASRAYFVGPVSVSCSMNQHDVVERGGEGETNCMRWLDSKEEQSVIFVSFGSQCYFKSAQLHELAMGLEESGQNFLWVVRCVDQSDEWMPEGWEERVADRGLVFINEKLLVDVVGCATRLWEGGKRSTRETECELVPRTVIAHAVSQFMEPEGENSSVHCKARELGAVIRSAMAEGGSSTSDLSRLISDLINAMQSKTCQ
ncbi:Glycosyltransferase [Rhynchospora pubera]|nr:Glycosyltransferase [Rhynchospora pubera]